MPPYEKLISPCVPAAGAAPSDSDRMRVVPVEGPPAAAVLGLAPQGSRLAEGALDHGSKELLLLLLVFQGPNPPDRALAPTAGPAVCGRAGPSFFALASATFFS